MNSQIFFLWNNHQKKLIQLQENNCTKLPFKVDHENETYYAWVGLPQFYVTPATEEAFLNMFSYFLQNMGNPKEKSVVSIDEYQSSYSVPVAFPASLDEYLHASSSFMSLKNDHVGVHPDFCYELFFRNQLGNFLRDMQLDHGSILEMGCGEGKHLLFLKDKFPLMSVNGIDATSTGIASARHAADHWGLDINFYSLKGEQSQLPDNSFDVVYCHALMMYRDINYNEIFQNMYRMSKRWILLIDCFPELWEPGTLRTMAALNYFQLKTYNLDFYNSLLRNDFKLNYKILAAQRLKHGWNPLCEPSLVIIEKIR